MKIVAYADGAVKGNGGPGRIGVGVVLLRVRDGEIVREFQTGWGCDLPHVTNILAELRAIQHAIITIRKTDWCRTDLEIYTDSEWSVKAIKGEYRNIVAHQKLLGQIRSCLSLFRSWKLEWVRGHAGDRYNEIANELAQQYAETAKKRKKKGSAKGVALPDGVSGLAGADGAILGDPGTADAGDGRADARVRRGRRGDRLGVEQGG